MSAELTATVQAVCRKSLGAYFEGYCWIKEKSKAFREGIPMHAYQRKLLEVQEWCAENEVPCRIVGLKPRRGGSSTFAIASMYHFLSGNGGRSGCVMTGSEYQGNNLFAMLRLMAKDDRTVQRRTIVLDTEARFPNGSSAVRINASNKNAGLSGGYDFMVITELSKWDEDGVAAAPDVLAGALKCVPFLPGTTIINESTADGFGNEYHRIYSSGITFEELKAGKVGYVKVFSPWFEFSDHVLDPAIMEVTIESLTSDERDLSARYSLTLEQISWMRYTIKDQCKGDFENFKENYPFNDVECFLLSGRKAFSARGLEKMKSDVYKFPVSLGIIDYVKASAGTKDEAVVWRGANQSDCQVLLWEHPRHGHKYLIAADTMTGASQTVGDDPDSHAIVVWRAGYFDRGQWCAPRIVAHLIDDWELWLNKRIYTCQWDIDILEDRVWRLALYYGRCMIVPEMNKDRGLVELLKLRNGGTIYTRTQFNRREQIETNALGWVTNPETRGRLVSVMQQGIREYGVVDPIKGWSQDRIEIYSPIILDQCEAFIVKSDGRCEAMTGKHDDMVLSCGIGLACIDQATTYQRPQGFEEPPWMRESSGQERHSGTYS